MGPAYSIASTMGPVVAAAGALAPISLICVSAIMLCIAVGFSQLARVAPNAGSSYSWIRLAFGSRAGAYGAWLLLLSNFFATMAIAVPAGIYTLDLVAPQRAQNPVWDAAVGAIWIVGSTILLYVGLRPTAVVTASALALELGVLGVSAIVALMHPHPMVPIHAAASGMGSKLLGASFFGFLSAMTLGVWMSDGWEVSASASEEVQGEDGRQAGRGGIMGLVLTTIVLAAAMAAYLHLGTISGFVANQADAMRYVADLLGGGAWPPIVIATVLVSTCSTLWTTILYLSRSVFAMGRDGVLPRALGKLDHRNEPLWSLATVAILVTVCELLTGFSQTAADALTAVLNASSVFLGLLFVFSAAAATRIFWNTARRWRGVVIPTVGAALLLGVLAATIAFEDRSLQLIAVAGLVLGIPFAYWRSLVRSGFARDRHALLHVERQRVLAVAAQRIDD